MEPLFAALSDLTPLKKNDEAKAIWLEIPRGTIDDYESFENMLEWGEVDSYAEYGKMWNEDYLAESCWYRLVIVASLSRNGTLRFRAVAFGDKTIISAVMDEGTNDDVFYPAENQTAEICSLLTILASDAMEKVRSGTYNDRINTALPYPFQRRRDSGQV